MSPMRTHRTPQIILGGYVVYALFLAVTVYCLPLTINETFPLPLPLPVITLQLLSLNITTVLLMVLILVIWHEQARVMRLISLTSTSRPMDRWIRPNFAGGGSHGITSGTIVMFLVTAIVTPGYIILENRETSQPPPRADNEEEFKELLAAAARPLTIIKTRPSPDRPWDSLPYTKLPVLRLELPRFSRFELDRALPRYRDGFNQEAAIAIYAKGTEQWPYVPAFFTYAGVRYPVDVRYRGWNFDHYLGFKKSWRIRLHKNDRFNGRRQFNIINQRDHSAINDLLWSEALRESGIMVPYQFLVHFRIDDEFHGIHTFLEQPDRHFAERHNRNASDIFGEKHSITRLEEFTKTINWQQYSSAGQIDDFTPLMELYTVALAKEHPDYLARMENLLDIDHYLKYLAHATITCTQNPSTHNIRWIRDPGVGRFQILPWYQASNRFIDEGHYDLWQRKGWSNHPPATAINDFADGLLRRPQMRQSYFRHLWRLLRSTHHRDHLKRKLNELYIYVRSDAYADTHMHYRNQMLRYLSNVEWEDTILRLREVIDDRLHFLERQIGGGPLRVSWSTAVKGDTANLGHLEIVTTNYCDCELRRLVFDCPSEWTGHTLVLATSGEKIAATVITTSNISTVTFLLNQTVSAKVERTPIAMGPSIFISDLGAIKNPEIDYLGGVSRLAPHYRPQPTTNTFLLTAFEAANAGPITLGTINLRNLITGRRMPTTGSTAPLEADRPAYSENAALALQSLTVPNPRDPEATLSFTEPDGVSLGDARVRVDRPIIIEAGIHRFSTTRLIGPEQLLIIKPGATLKFDPGCSLIVRGGLLAEGQPDQAIRFTSSEPGSTWGVVFLNSNQRFTNRLAHCIFERSTNVMINGLAVTAGLAAYSAPCEIRDCVFRDIVANDAFNSKYISPTIISCTFSNNIDAIDIDMGGGRIADCLLLNNRDDCIDLSSAWTLIEGNRIHSYGDKGISVGEKSRPVIFNNIITDATMAIAVKDLSSTLILNNTLVSNRTAVAVYRKKISFGPATASLVNNILHFNGRAIETDQGSTVSARYNSASTRLSGEGNNTAVPDFEPGTLRLRRNDILSSSGSGKPPSFYGLPGDKPIRQMGQF